MNIFVINLLKDKQKKNYIVQHFAQMGITSYEFMEAVDGKVLSPSELDAVYDHALNMARWKRALCLPEIGCALSHLRCYQKILQENLPGAFIFEDDCQLNGHVPSIMRRVSEYCDPHAPQIVLLTYAYQLRRTSLAKLSQAHRLNPVYKADSSHGYYITQAAAQKMLEIYKKISMPIDSWSRLIRDHHMSILAVYPYCVSLMENHEAYSSIATERRKNTQKFRPWYRAGYKKMRERVLKPLGYKLAALMFGIIRQTKV